MKRITLFLFSCFLCLMGQSQWTINGTSIYYNGGNVGIGLTNPALTLEMMTTSMADGIQLKYNGAAGFVRLTGNSIAQGYLNPITLSGDAGLIYAGSTVDAVTTGFVIAPYRSTMGGLRVDNNGNVGIKTNNTQGYQLAVNGSAIFTSAWIKPYANWPDYVFNRGYSLPSLDSLSRYIQETHHLPDIPSADSVQQKGLDLGGTEAALLRKIEELTLYMIEQNKRLGEQQKEIDQLKQLVSPPINK